MVVGIIGAGASGMAAALTASENANVQVVLMERQARVGRKLLATGNGRCNLTNMRPRDYHGTHPEFALPALQAFDANKTRIWFRCKGLYTVSEPSGRVYPYSDQANSVVDILRLSLQRENIKLLTGFEVTKMKRTESGFVVSNGEETVTCNRLIVACGGLAGTKLGGSMSGYKLLAKLGHRSTKLRPALVQLKSPWHGLASLKGVRANCRVHIYQDASLFAQSEGELQFTDYGLSGPVIFEVSRDACAQPGDWSCRMDFLPAWTEEDVFNELRCRIQSPLPVQELFTGILHNRLGRVLTQAVGISMNKWCWDLTENELYALVHAVKDFSVPLTEPMGMDSAQVTAGGVLTEDFDPETMESRLVPGLFACGEVLDIDGDCGGYNLQWAWSSGRLAGLHAGKDNG